MFLVGDAISVLSAMPAESVSCCVTSPPYYGLRDYGDPKQLGLENTPEEYIARLVGVFREVRRVLQADGTLWLNLGDSYARAGGWSDNHGLDGVARGEAKRAKSNMTGVGGTTQKLPAGYKQKDLFGIPWAVAFALRADGWFLRSDIIWHKPNPVPESAQDRCTRAHEYVFLLTKNARYFYNASAIAEEAKFGEHHKKYQGSYTRHKIKAMQERGATNGVKYNRGLQSAAKNPLVRNARSVWSVTVQAFKGAHFATMPIALAERCISAGSKLGDVVLDPFGGAGTTAVAAQNLGRRSIYIDINKNYFDLAKERFENHGIKMLEGMLK